MLLARQLFIKCFSFFLLAYLLLDKKTTMVGAVRVILNSISSISKNRTLVAARYVSLYLGLIFGLLSVFITPAHAYQRSYTNLGFETPSIATGAPCRVYITNTKVTGWLTTHSFYQEEGSPNGGAANCGTGVVNNGVISGQILEIWKGPRNNNTGGLPISAREGTQFAELNAEQITEMSQNVCLVNGEPVTWRLSHNGRAATDSMTFRAGTQAVANVSTSEWGDGAVTCLSGTCVVDSQVTNVSGNGTRWADYSGTFAYTGASGQAVLGFQSTSGSATSGNFLDAIQITVKPIIEFSSANYSIPENNLSPPPIQVVIAGIVPVGGIVLTFNVTGGTAILGSDYTVNGGSATTFDVTLPAGDYGQGTPLIVNVPVSIIDDTTYEPDESFTVSIAPDVNNFHLMSTSVCGASGNGTATYNIIDDDDPQDFDVSVVKAQRAGTSGTFITTPLTVRDGTVQYRLIMTNNGAKTITSGAPATFSDVVPANVGLVATNFGFTGGSGSTSCTASRTGNTVTGSFSGPTGATCTVIMQGTASTTGTITNTATASVPAGNNDIFPSDNSSSVVTTIARATLILNKISNGSIGTFGFTLTNTTQNTGNSVTTTVPGVLTQVDGNISTGGMQPFTISAAGNITINESTIPAGWTLASAACTNAAGAGVGSLSGTTYTIPSASNVSGEVFTCNFLNNRPPTIKVEKISYGGTAGFTFADYNLTGSIGTLTTTTSGVGVTSAVLPVAIATTDVTITETLVGGYTLTSASCIDENSALTGKIGTFGTLITNASTGVLTVPAANFVVGADIKCTFNNRRSTTLTLRKTWAAGSQAGHTATVTSSGFINAATSGSSTATLAGNTTIGALATVYVGESGTIGEIFGGGAVAADYNGVLACTGTNGSLTGNTLTITQSTGTAIVCTYTNTKLPKITLTKISNGGVGAFSFTGNNGFTNQTITTVTAGTGVTGAVQTLAAALTATTITETIPAGYIVTAINCTGLGSGTQTTDLAAGSVVLNAAATAAGSNIDCTFTNAKKPLLRVSKIVSSILDTDDRFMTEIRAVSVTDPVLSTTTNNATTGGGVLTAGGVATYTALGSYEGAIGTQYFITESLTVGTSVLGKYTTSISCTNSYAPPSSPTILPSGSTAPFTVTPQAGDDISCTLTNAIKQPTVTITKISNDAIGTFNFVNTNLASAATAIPTVTQGVAVSSAVIAVTTRDALVTVAETVPSGWTLISATCTDANSAITGNPPSFGTLATSTLTIPAVNVVAGADINCTYTNTKTVIQGKVFFDNGKAAATPHNGTQETGELGIGNITMTLTDCASTTYQTVLTDGAGAYSFTIPNSLTTGTTLCVEEHQPSTLVSVTGVVGTTSGTYSLASDRTQFSLTINTNYTGVNFGDVAESQLTGTGNQTISAGTTASYIHQFIAGTEGVVTLTTAQAPSPNISGWTSLMYLDATCDAELNAGDTQITAPISVVADQLLCLIQKVQSPVTATNGAMNISTVSASFAFAAPSVIVRPYSQPDTTIVMDASLVLIKRLRQVSSCPSTGADVNPFITNNQALPNTYIEYQIQYSNPSAATLSNITVHDVTPAFTEFRSANCTTTPSSLLCATPSSGSGTAPNIGGVGDIDWVLTNNPTGLGAGQSGEVRFCVRISP